jgi:hypothetical protein
MERVTAIARPSIEHVRNVRRMPLSVTFLFHPR